MTITYTSEGRRSGSYTILADGQEIGIVRSHDGRASKSRWRAHATTNGEPLPTPIYVFAATRKAAAEDLHRLLKEDS